MIHRNVNLHAHNTLRLASTANAYSKISNLKELSTAIAFSHAEQLPIIPLGEGSNVILQRAINAYILDIQLRGIKKIKENDSHIWIEVGAGENWHQWVMHSIAERWFGLENLALIPGRVGAAPIQNIGAYGCEVSSFIDSVKLVNVNQESTDKLSLSTLSTKQCQFAYRDSIFKQSLNAQTIITSVVFKLNKTFIPQLSYPALKQQIELKRLATINAIDVADTVIAIRSEKLPDPKTLANAGSFFKNIAINQQQLDSFILKHPSAPYFQYNHSNSPDNIGYKIPAAWLIEQCGFKGAKSGHLGMHKQQALVLINYSDSETSSIDTASSNPAPNATDVINFSEKIIAAVKQRFGFTLQREPQIIP